MTVLTFLLCSFLLGVHANPEPRTAQSQMALCTIMKNEHKYIRTWLNYHHYLGVDYFMIYDDNSTDQSAKIAQNWAEETGDVYMNIQTIHPESNIYQSELYHRCLEKWRGRNFWLGFVDTDELIVPLKKNSILRALKPFEEDNVSALFISSKVMCDYSGENENDRSKNFIHRFTNYALTNRTEYTQGKILVKMDHPALDYCKFGTSDPLRPDRWRFYHNCYWSKFPTSSAFSTLSQNRELPKRYLTQNDRGRPVYHPYLDIDHATQTMRPSFDVFQINHYKFKSETECFQKIERGYSWFKNRYGPYEKWPQFAKEKTKPNFCTRLKRKNHCQPKVSSRAQFLYKLSKN